MQTEEHVLVLSHYLPVTNPSDTLQKWIIKSGNLPTKMKAQQKTKSDSTRSEILTEHKWSYRRKNWTETADNAAVSEPKYAVRGTLWRQNYQHKWGVCVMKRVMMSQRKWRQPKLYIKGTLGYICDIESAMDKILKADLNFGKSITICPRPRNDTHSTLQVIQRRRNQALFKLLLINCLQRNKTL